MVQSQTAVWTCTACLRAQACRRGPVAQRGQWRALSASTRVLDEQQQNKNSTTTDQQKASDEEKGAMSRRLADMAEETIDTGSKSDRKLMTDAGFSDDLKKQLEDRIAQTAFQAENQQAVSQATMPSSAGRGTRDQAAARAWDGNEPIADAALRMLDDSHKRIRMPARKPTLGATGINLKPKPKQKVSVADRLVNARDRTSMYALSQQNLSEQEKEKFRQELKDKFQPGARPMPTTLQGLTSLANERIEDAIARGQFKHIQRGKGVNIERDYTANSPFLDTTEYFMNKIIQKQEIVPPWIEKQQELMKSVNIFRGRLRNDWRRHAARSISSKGGSVEEQVRRAKAYALAEEKQNPRPASRSEAMSSIDPTGILTTITVEERIAANIAPEPAQNPVAIKVTETALVDGANGEPAQTEKTIAEESVIVSTTTVESAQTDPAVAQPDRDSDAQASSTTTSTTPVSQSLPCSTPTILPMSHPFRDPSWEQTELAYHTLAIRELNSLTRSYNLMAPKIAQKPYYTLTRELNRMYMDVAPTVADEILQRSRKGPVRVQVSMHREGGVLERLGGTGHVARVRDEDSRKGYGFKEFWRDLFRGEGEGKNGVMRKPSR